MKKAILTISALMISAMISTGAFATVPDLIPVQGVLADSADLPIDALTDMTFTLYDGESSATVLWTDTFVDVDVVEGFFTVYLGDNTALPFASLISNSEVWMGITVETDPEMDRVQLATVPFAIEAQVCQAVGSLTEADIITTSDPAGGIVAGDITNWDAAYGWGDHSVEGYLTTESDPIFGASAASGIAAGDITNWTTAYGWGDHAGIYAPLSHTHDWSTITGIPAGFADGVDNNTTYSAGLGLTLAGTTFAANTTYLQRRVTGTCAVGSSIRMISSTGTVTCEADTNTNTNAATICAAGYFLNGDGSCDAVTSGDITGVTAGGGLSGGGTSGSVSLAVNMHHYSNYISAVLASGSNHVYTSGTYTPTVNGVCVVSINANFPGAESNGSGGPYLRVAFERNGSDYNDSSFGFYAETGDHHMSRTSHINTTAGLTYRFGCFFGSPGTDWQETVYCRTSYFCY